MFAVRLMGVRGAVRIPRAYVRARIACGRSLCARVSHARAHTRLVSSVSTTDSPWLAGAGEPLKGVLR